VNLEEQPIHTDRGSGADQICDTFSTTARFVTFSAGKLDSVCGV
jgi:hypothetical protein